MSCSTCAMIGMIEKTYPKRKASFGVQDKRCLWHAWEDDGVFKCDICQSNVFPEEVSFCLKKNQYICTFCAESKRIEESFWVWKDYSDVACPFCGGFHPTLPRQEFLGEHPWQADPFSCKDFPIWYPGGRLIEEKDVEKT